MKSFKEDPLSVLDQDPGSIPHHMIKQLMELDAANQQGLVAVIAKKLEQAIQYVSIRPHMVSVLTRSKGGQSVFRENAHFLALLCWIKTPHDDYGFHPKVALPPPCLLTPFVTVLPSPLSSAVSEDCFLTFSLRIERYSSASPCCYAISLIYLERLKRRAPDIFLNSYNWQRLILVSMMLATKTFDDKYYSNKVWGKIGGISTLELNNLEMEFLNLMGWRMQMNRDEYEWYAEELRADPLFNSTGPLSEMFVACTISSQQVRVRKASGEEALLRVEGSKSALQQDENFLSARTTPSSSLNNPKITSNCSAVGKHKQDFFRSSTGMTRGEARRRMEGAGEDC
eukprot:763977-Hanusia_phi.AAC.1